jgi:hypothetical protein
LTFALRTAVAVETVAVEHAKKTIAYDAGASAPRHFDLFLYPEGPDEPAIAAGSFVYDVDKVLST